MSLIPKKTQGVHTQQKLKKELAGLLRNKTSHASFPLRCGEYAANAGLGLPSPVHRQFFRQSAVALAHAGLTSQPRGSLLEIEAHPHSARGFAVALVHASITASTVSSLIGSTISCGAKRTGSNHSTTPLERPMQRHQCVNITAYLEIRPGGVRGACSPFELPEASANCLSKSSTRTSRHRMASAIHLPGSPSLAAFMTQFNVHHLWGPKIRAQAKMA